MPINKNEKAKILIVDDSEECRLILREMLQEHFEVAEADSGAAALVTLTYAEKKPELILLDILMPEMDGYRVINALKKEPHWQHIPIICITMADEEYKGLSAGAVDYISKPFDPEAVKLRISNQIELLRYRHHLEKMVEDKAKELVSTKETILETLANMIEYRSLESGTHIKRTQILTEILVEHLLTHRKYGKILEQYNVNAMIKASALHDIGKIGIPDNILLKPGRLTLDEFKVIETHTVIGSEIFKGIIQHHDEEYFHFCYDISRYHHEHWNGDGYPDKLQQEEIPLSARILALVDVYDALVSKRCYKKAMPHNKALEIVMNGAGYHFDPEIVTAFVEVQDKIKLAMTRL